jgi:signal transduction histidine kinase
MAVPLEVANRTFGALTLFATGRHYGTEDLDLAKEVAFRVSMALENARHCEVAQDAVRAREDFVVLASHELRTPLSSLALLVEHKLRRRRNGERPEDPEQNEAIARKQDDAIARQVNRLIGLVERMLEAVRVESEGIPLSLQDCDVGVIVRKAVTEAGDRARRSGAGPIELRSEAGSDALHAFWDPARIGRALDELLDNAIKFGAAAPIALVLRRDGSDAVVTVRDHGPGVPAERIPAIFSPFERAVSKEHFGGLGLGLFVAKAIVEAHGGTLEAACHPLQSSGTTFTMRMPLTATHA